MKGRQKKIILEDGTEYLGTAFGADSEQMAELVFNTSMAGYQELLSDLSYTGQAVVMTYPLIGNYGICKEDYESAALENKLKDAAVDSLKISALIVREYCDEPSNFRSVDTLGAIMERNGIIGVAGVDTRKLTRHIRDYGSCRAYIVNAERDSGEALRELREWTPDAAVVSKVSTPCIYEYTGEPASTDNDESVYVLKTEDNCENENRQIHTADGTGKRIVVIDCGVKLNILRELYSKGCRITVVPWNTSADKILELCPDGVLVSNGPGNPEDVGETINTVRNLIGKCPVFGICLGHQIISLAYGAKTYKLKFGHRGGNHPVKNLKTGLVEITSQNHSYAVDIESIKNTGLAVTHINLLDGTVEGTECVKDRVATIQYHPEGAPGPHDGAYLFGEFLSIMG